MTFKRLAAEHHHMVALPNGLPHTARAVAAAREARQENWDSYGLSMSELGSECDRALWYAFRWASQPERIDGQKARRFETGNIEEKRILDDLERTPGITVERLDPTTGKQFKCYLVGGHVRGKMDGKGAGFPEATVTVHVIEAKSHNAKSFADLVKRKVQVSKPAHYWQCQLYMHYQSLTRCIYYAVNKDTDEEHSERLEYDPVACMRMLVRLERIITSVRAPSRISEDIKSFSCMFCRHKSVCHKHEFGRSHCRSCVHATPIIDPVDTAGQWLCERHNKTLTMDEQRAGCGDHLYVPDFVPGEQVDAGDDFVVYTMIDGATWTDAVKAPAVRYWYHPESGSLWTTEDGSHPGSDGLVEELTIDEYETALAYYASQKAAP